MPDQILPAILTVVTSVTGSVISYQLIDVARKRKIETYWKMEEEYKSEAQTEARKLIGEMEEEFIRISGQSSLDKLERPVFDRLVEYYNKTYHKSRNKYKKEKAVKIRSRLRLLNQMGILLKKRMVDKELLLSLIGLGLKIDHPVLSIILTAHRDAHKTRRLYDQFEYLWKTYSSWKRR